ncbi:MAG: energy-coupling factor ABC transporter permease [Candidatus Thorarchaeota archaeon]
MHVPDGIIPLWLQITFFVISGLMFVISYRKVKAQFDDRLVPFMGVLAAVIFAAQLVNFPIPPFSSGHLVGSTLLAVLVSPWVAMLIMALVLFIQALFGDGGLLTYGLNAFNMAIFSVLVGYGLALMLFRATRGHTTRERSLVFSAGIASFIATVSAAFVLGIELLSVPGFSLTALMAITWIHALIGVGEAILTAIILGYFIKANPELVMLLRDGTPEKVEERPSVEEEEVEPVEQERWITRQIVPLLLTAVAIVAFVILTGLASGNPDGFEWALFIFAGVSEPEGTFDGLFAFLGSNPVIDVVTGLVGILAALGLAYLVFTLVSRKKG